LTQEDYDHLYTGKEYNIAYSYATLHTVTWVALTFSSAMPLVYPIAFLYYAVTYWVDKWLMLRFYRKTITFDEQVPVRSLGLIKWPVLIHGLVAIFMLSSEEVFFTSNVKETDFNSNIEQETAIAAELMSKVSKHGSLHDTTMDLRLQKSHVIMVLVFYIFLVGCYVFQELLTKCLDCIFGSEESEYLEDDVDQMDEEDRQHYEKVQRYQRNKQQREQGQSRSKVASVNEGPDSSEQELQEYRTADGGTAIQLKKARPDMGQYRDDFYEEINVENLIKYYKRNEIDLQ